MRPNLLREFACLEEIAWVFVVHLIDSFKFDHLEVPPTSEATSEVGNSVGEVRVLGGAIATLLVVVFLVLRKIFVYLISQDLRLVLVEDWIKLVSHALAPEEDRVDVTFTHPAVALIVWLVRNSRIDVFHVPIVFHSLCSFIWILTFPPFLAFQVRSERSSCRCLVPLCTTWPLLSMTEEPLQDQPVRWTICNGVLFVSLDC